jgi:hypothetical protein
MDSSNKTSIKTTLEATTKIEEAIREEEVEASTTTLLKNRYNVRSVLSEDMEY